MEHKYIAWITRYFMYKDRELAILDVANINSWKKPYTLLLNVFLKANRSCEKSITLK